VDNILDLGQHLGMIYYDDWPPLIVVNRVGLPQTSLPTFLNFPHFRAFKEWKPQDDLGWTMGLHIGITTMFDISKGVHRSILGQVMNLNYFTWFLNLVLAKQTCLAQSFPFIHPILHLLHSQLG
jgi:hypothetical protein